MDCTDNCLWPCGVPWPTCLPAWCDTGYLLANTVFSYFKMEIGLLIFLLIVKYKLLKKEKLKILMQRENHLKFCFSFFWFVSFDFLVGKCDKSFSETLMDSSMLVLSHPAPPSIPRCELPFIAAESAAVRA